jgi:hypothetical protein
VTLDGGLAQPTAISARAPLLGLLELSIRVAQVPVRVDESVARSAFGHQVQRPAGGQVVNILRAHDLLPWWYVSLHRKSRLPP